jgi:hypothetical protein
MRIPEKYNIEMISTTHVMTIGCAVELMRFELTTSCMPSGPGGF